jgi:Putative zinc finger in N-recognin (UBR box)
MAPTYPGKRIRDQTRSLGVFGSTDLDRTLKRRAHYPCTFDLGYVRQDVYACTECTRADSVAGFCGGCKLACHGEHLDKVIDLYSKRDFRCDCGNSSMNSHCMLEPEKPLLNPDNHLIYSHNFRGLYCRCDRGYDAKLGDMSQCACCEDWFHAVCINVPGLSKKAARRALRGSHYEFMCRNCVINLPLLARYLPTLGLFKPKDLAIKELPASDRPDYCKAPNVTVVDMPVAVDYFWKPGFREHLCTCFDCQALYHAADVPFIAERRDYAPGSSAHDPKLLDETADAQIIRDILRDGSKEAAKSTDNTTHRGERIGDGKDSSLQSGAGHDPERERHGLPSAGGDKQSPNPSSEKSEDDTSDDDSVDAEQLRIQCRIRDFLRKTIESDGRTMTHGAVRAYLADLKAELLANSGTS